MEKRIPSHNILQPPTYRKMWKRANNLFTMIFLIGLGAIFLGFYVSVDHHTHDHGYVQGHPELKAPIVISGLLITAMGVGVLIYRKAKPIDKRIPVIGQLQFHESGLSLTLTGKPKSLAWQDISRINVYYSYGRSLLSKGAVEDHFMEVEALHLQLVTDIRVENLHVCNREISLSKKGELYRKLLFLKKQDRRMFSMIQFWDKYKS